MTYFLIISYHRSIQMTPTEVSLAKNSKAVYNSLFHMEITPKKDKNYSKFYGRNICDFEGS